MVDMLSPSLQRVHILHVVRRGFAGGGLENGIVNVANCLRSDQYRISVCALDSEETFSGRIRRPDSEYYLLPKRGDGIDWSLIWSLERLFRSAKIDLVHSHNWGTFLYAVLAAQLARVPIIHGEHGKTQSDLQQTGMLKRRTKSLLGRRVDRLVTVSQGIAAEWASYGVPVDRIQWIPNGVDTERFRPRTDQRESRLRFGLPESALLIGGIGRLDALKNFEVLVAAFAKIANDFPDLHLALLGDGPCRERLHGQGKKFGVTDRVSILGWRPDPENFLVALDVFVLPSKYEGMSNVVLEAMASGLPVVCADLPAHREVFEPGRDGVVVSPCTAKTLADVLAELCRDRARRQSLGSAARKQVVARFSISRMVSDYEQLYARYACPEAVVDSVPPEMPDRIQGDTFVR
jgi:sugar transferase (PEP-CTERM/EpsH1 system associated)